MNRILDALPVPQRPAPMPTMPPAASGLPAAIREAANEIVPTIARAAIASTLAAAKGPEDSGNTVFVVPVVVFINSGVMQFRPELDAENKAEIANK